MKLLSLVFISLLFFCCSSTKQVSLGDSTPFGYHPLDPLPVRFPKTTIPAEKKTILNSLPDETMRIAIGEVTTNNGITFSSAKVGVENKEYVVILDYIKFNTYSFDVTLKNIPNSSNKTAIIESGDTEGTSAIVPVYVGVGLRLTANIKVLKGTVDLGNLFALGAASSSEKITGTLVVQTLGISGENISNIIPMPSEISPATIQNAIMALGTIKSKIYDEKTMITPRIVGVYNNLGGSSSINSFISELLKKPITLDLLADLNANQ